jgi:hypothetical protein
MRSVENADLTEQDDGYATSFAFADFSPKSLQHCLYVFPGDVRAGGVCEDSCQSPLMGAFHPRMVPERGTVGNAGCFLMPNVRAKRATTAGHQARAGENVPRTARPGLVVCRWRSA